ncbi:protease SohB [Gallibacterium salpingitidis]|uniref:Peptidase n=1 Tax=Gallibacterium salpingitidis TaxID=505341 RepID=A0A1A7NQ46_9PAST|nr:protease SohB [Gallibacterium salpingitidis]OBW92322.1 peptidase [Gallibacterium salpingitidis]
MWSDILMNYSVFILEVITLVVVVAVIFAVIFVLKQKNHAKAGELRITNLNHQYEDQQQLLKTFRLDEHQVKQLEKARKKQEKAEAKAAKKKAKQAEKTEQSQTEQNLFAEQKPCLFVLDFNGDIQANAAAALREELNAILAVARPEKDEVLLRLESPGGVVHGYGFAASQLQRLRDKQIPLTIAVDKVAASGGYMMACVANKIVAAPFAIIGSIGVVAQVPNIYRLLKKHDVDVDVMTAGEYKRTVTVLGENTEKGKQKFQQELEETHQLFKQFVAEHRPQVEIEKVATGEHWFGKQALDLALIDEVKTSDDLILQAITEKDVLQVKYCVKKSLVQKLGKQAEESATSVLEKALYQDRRTFF